MRAVRDARDFCGVGEIGIYECAHARNMTPSGSTVEQSTADAAFDVDLDELQRLLLDNAPLRSERQRLGMETDARHTVMSKFRRLTQSANVDFLSDFSGCIILVMCSKFPDKTTLVASVLRRITGDALTHVLSQVYEADELHAHIAGVHTWNPECVSCWSDVQNQTCNTVTDWTMLLEYVEFAPEIELRLERHELVDRMRSACIEAELASSFLLTTPFLCSMLLHMYIDSVPSAKLVERLLSRKHSLFVRDLAIRVLRAVNLYQDARVDSVREQEQMSDIYAEARFSTLYQQHMRALMLHDFDNEQSQAAALDNVPQRLQLRFLQAPSKQGTRDAIHTFSAWAAQQQFSVVSSKQRQLILYFALVQQQRVPRQMLAPFFTDAILARYERCLAVPHVDVDAITQLLQYVRTYRNNITSLVDFRATCLRGLSARQREALTLVQVFQLYVIAFQHESIRNELWKRFCPVSNHTTVCSITEFERTNVCEIQAVLVNLAHDSETLAPTITSSVAASAVASATASVATPPPDPVCPSY